MRLKKIISRVLAAVLCISGVGLVPPDYAVQAKTDTVSNFHYEQLNETAQHIYDGMYAMYEKGLLKTGTQDYDLVTNGHFSNQQAADYSKNSSELTRAMNAARYAFYADYPEIFYVDFPKLSLRTMKGTDGSFHMYLGSGRYASYLNAGFSSKADVDAAISAFDARVAEIVAGAKGLTIQEGQNKQAEQITYVHNEIINHASYRLEDTCFEGDGDHPSNAAYLSTPYGILVKKQGVCEGYARAFKTVMDKLDMNCILVQGVHQYDSEVAVAHMWNYVELDGKWYAVDLTQDDPEWLVSDTEEYITYTQHFDAYGKDELENEKYLLVGQLTMNTRHFVNESVDAAGGYAFAYPVLEDNDFGVKEVLNDMDGFFIKQKTVPTSTGNDVTEFQISYRGMNFTEAKKQGIYLLARYYDYGEGDESDCVVPISEWCYFSEDYALKEDDTSVYIQEGEALYMEFAATNIKPREGLDGLTYVGDDFGIIARTGKLYNEHQNGYVAPPFISRVTPSQTATLSIVNRPYHVTIVYDETLRLEEGWTAETLGYEIVCKSGIGATTSGEKYSKIENITWDGDKTVTFDLTFSQMYADDNVSYSIYITGLVGAESQKRPNPVVYGARYDTLCPSVQQRRGFWDIFGKPTLLENEDLSVNGWKMSNGKEVSDKLKDRLTLITTKTTDIQEAQMQAALDQEFPGVSDKIVKSSTYNITLSVCKEVVVQTGHKVKVRLGFPDGYGPEDEGVTYKAYHFKRDAQGTVIGVEEIDCVVTPYGLVISCDSFSPFAIAAIEADGNEQPQEVSVIATASDGGTITGADLNDARILKLSNGDSKTLHVKANEGYEIESVSICGKEAVITDKNEMDVTVNYGAVGANNIVHATFVAKAVVQKEAARKETPVKPAVTPVTVSLPSSLMASNQLTITPVISGSTGIHSYQWYKDGKKLPGKTALELSVSNVTDADAGSYQLEVTTTVDTLSSTVMSDPCNVSIGNCKHTNTTEYPAAASTCTIQGHGAYTFCNLCKTIASGSDAKLPLAPHIFEEKVDAAYLKSEATCSAKAIYFKSCSICGDVSTETFESGNLGDHVPSVRDKKQATCTEDGYTGDTYCEICDTKLETGSKIPATGHMITKIEAKDATHEADGNIAYYQCVGCKMAFEDENGTKSIPAEQVVIPKLGHKFEDKFQSDKENHWKACSCGAVDEKAPHTFGDWTVVKQASKTEAGSKERTCSVCGYKESVELPATGSAPKSPETGEPISPETGESNLAVLWYFLAVVLLGGFFTLHRNSFLNK